MCRSVDREPEHLDAVGVRGERLCGFVGRSPRWQKDDPPKRQADAQNLGDDEMADVYGIERAAKYSYALNYRTR